MAKNLVSAAVGCVTDFIDTYCEQMDKWREEDPENYYEYTFNQMEV